MPAILHAIATAAPPGACSQARAAVLAAQRCCSTAQQASWLTSRFERSGVVRRGSILMTADGGSEPFEALYALPRGAGDAGPTTAARMREFAAAAPRLAAAAGSAALARAQLRPDEITHLVTVSCTGFMAPGLDTLLIRALELPRGVGRAHLGFMGCHGAFNGLGVAAAFAATSPRARVLVCAVELCSLHLQYGHDRGQVVANALFADGAAAFVVGPDDGGDAVERSQHLEPGRRPWRLAGTASCLLPDSEEAMTWTIGDHGFAMGLQPSVPLLIQLSLRSWLVSWLAEHDLTLSSVRSWAIHPGGPQILDAVERALELSPAATRPSREVLAEHGNMSSATLGFLLEPLAAAGSPRPCVALGFGPGLMAEAALFV